MRLTNEIRHLIIDNAMKRFKEKEEKAQTFYREASVVIYKHVIKTLLGETRGEIFLNLDYPFVEVSNSFGIRIGEDEYSLDLPRGTGVPTSMVTVEPSPALLQLIKVLNSADVERERVSIHKDTAKRQVKALVGSVTTIKKLAEVWPEGAAFYAEFNDETRNLPAIPTTELNQLLGLTSVN